MISVRSLGVRVLSTALALSASTIVHADAPVASIPKEISFVGLQAGQWRLFVGGEQGLRHVRTTSEPRTPAYSLAHNRIAYVCDQGAIREIALATGEDTVVIEAQPAQAFTQLTYRPGSDELYVVVLHQGSSVDTDLARIDRKRKVAMIVSRQRSAQFEPTFTRDGKQLLYSSVSCASECPKIIQELWSMDLVSAVPMQLTLLNSISRQAVVDGRGRIVFSSNREGFYQLWRLDPQARKPERLTQAAAVDESPAVSASGEVFFIRREAKGARLMRLDVLGAAREVAIDTETTDLRDLRSGAGT